MAKKNAKKSAKRLRLKKQPLSDLPPKKRSGSVKGGVLGVNLTNTMDPKLTTLAPPYIPVKPVL